MKLAGLPDVHLLLNQYNLWAELYLRVVGCLPAALKAQVPREVEVWESCEVLGVRVYK
jgi:hypothetical protein